MGAPSGVLKVFEICLWNRPSGGRPGRPERGREASSAPGIKRQIFTTSNTIEVLWYSGVRYAGKP